MRVFGTKSFFRLWLAQVVSSLGDWIGLIAILAIAARVAQDQPAKPGGEEYQIGSLYGFGNFRTILFGGLPLFHTFGQTVVLNAGLRAGATIVMMPRFNGEDALRLTYIPA